MKLLTFTNWRSALGKLADNRYTIELSPSCQSFLAIYADIPDCARVCAVIFDRISANPHAFPIAPPITTWRAAKSNPVGNLPGFVFFFQINEDDRIVRIFDIYIRPGR